MQTLRVKADALKIENGVLRGVAVASVGPALGHGFHLDRLTLEQFLKAIGKGVPVRLTHDYKDGLPATVGLLTNVRIDGDTLRGDVDLSIGASSPMGDMKTFLSELAEALPGSFGLSLTFDDSGFEDRDGQKFVRVSKVHSADFVDSPASNRSGLLSKGNSMEQIVEWARSLGYDGDGTPEDVLGFLKGKMPAPDSGETEDTGNQMSAKAPTAMTLAARAERDRIAGLRKLAATHKLNETWVLNHAERGTPVLLAQQMAEELAAWRQNNRGIPMSVNNVTVGADLHRESFRPALVDGLCLHAGIPIKDVHPRANEFRALRTWEVARVLLAEAGIPITGLSPSALITEARKNRHQLAMSSSDFDSILADTIGKTLRRGYAEVEKDWPKFCARAQAPDFKIITRAQLGAVPTPTERKEGAGVTFTTINDDKVEYRLAEYAQGIRITRRALINDDTDAFSRIPTMQGAACARLEDDVAFAVLTANATMGDGYALFSDEHSNLISTGNAAISVASLATTATKLAVQQRDSAMLALKPAALICRSADMVTAWQILNSTSDPTADLSSGAANPFRGALTLVANPRLDATGNAYWYLAAAPSLIEGIEVCFLADEPAPTIRQVVDDYTEDVDFLCRHTVAAAAIDYRAVVRNNG